MKSANKNKKKVPKPAQKSIIQLAEEIIPEGKFKGITTLLEPHELRDRTKRA